MRDPYVRPDLRIGDAERNAAADELAEHYAQGRLTTEEHHERLDRIWAARTQAQLAPIFSDLPGSTPESRSAGVGEQRVRTARASAGYGHPRHQGYAVRRGLARRLGLLPVLVRIALVVLLAVLVLAHLPLLLLGLVVWLVLTHRFRPASARPAGSRPASSRHGYVAHRRW